MIRVITFLLAVAVLATGFAWIADRPGDVVVTWLGYRLETSVLVGGLALVVLVIALTLAFAFLRGILRSPEQVSLFFRHRRAVKGYLTLTRGLIAIGAGDLKLARRSANDAARLAPGDPLTLLLIAQSAQMAGDRGAAERAFRDMTRRDDTKLLGLRGLYIEAQRRNDTRGARRVAEEAAKTAPGLPWAGQAVLDDRCAASDWAGALDALDHMKSALPKPEYRRKRAVLLTAQALALDENDRDASRAAVLEAVKLAPELVPAAALAGRRLAESNDWRKARKILETTWTINPHPDLADAYGNLRFGDSARERLMRMQKLASKVEGQREGALAVAQAALDAQEFKVARDALAPHLPAPTRRVATLMAQIEEAEHGDTGRVREWMSRALRAAPDPVWTADGVVSERWLPVTPNGRLDGFEWKLPLAELGISRPVIEAALPPPEPLAPKPVAPPPRPRKSARSADKAARARPVEPVIPLVHAPDDPGTEIGLDADPVPEPGTPPPADAWQRIRGLFR
jgi:HemY protein